MLELKVLQLLREPLRKLFLWCRFIEPWFLKASQFFKIK
jgi:hypothetical protein